MKFENFKDMLLEEFVMGDSFVVTEFNDCQNEESFSLLLKEDINISAKIAMDSKLKVREIELCYGDMKLDQIEYFKTGVLNITYNGTSIINESVMYIVRNDNSVCILPLTLNKELANERYCLFEQINETLFDGLNAFLYYSKEFDIKPMNTSWKFWI